VVGTSKLRVHALVDSLTFGGAELLLAELAAAAPGAGIELSVGYLLERNRSPAAARLRAAGVEPTLVGIPPRLYTNAVWLVRRHLALQSPDIVHTHLIGADLTGVLAARSLGLPVVSTIHSVAAGFSAAEGLRDRARDGLRTLLTRTFAARVIAVSEEARAAHLAHRGGSPDHVLMIHNGVARRPRPGAGASVREELGLDPDQLVVATLSTLRPVKAQEVAIEAVARLQRRFPRLRLLIVGEGTARPELERRAAAHGDLVHMIGFRDDTMAVLDAADVLVHPSRQEAFPTALLEAMAAGVPQVATAVGGIPEIVEDGGTGLLIEAPPDAGAVAEKLALLLEDQALRLQLGRRGVERFEQRFEAGAWAERLRTVYEEVIESAAPATRPRRRRV